MARNELVTGIRTGDDVLVVVLRDLLKSLARLWCCHCGNRCEVEVKMGMQDRRRRTRESSSQISRVYLWSDRLVAKGIIVVTYVIYRLIACTTKPRTSKSATMQNSMLAPNRTKKPTDCPMSMFAERENSRNDSEGSTRTISVPSPFNCLNVT